MSNPVPARCIAGSAGDAQAAQLIIDNRSTYIEYARDNGAHPRHGSMHNKPPPMKSDWACESCGCNNFARRDACFRCNASRSERAFSSSAAATAPGAAVAATATYHGTPFERFGDSLVAAESPSATLVMKGFQPTVAEDQVSRCVNPPPGFKPRADNALAA